MRRRVTGPSGCIGQTLCCYDKIPGISSLRGKGLLWPLFSKVLIMVERARATKVAPIIAARFSWFSCASWFSPLLHFIPLGPQDYRMMLPTFRVDAMPLANLLCKHSPRVLLISEVFLRPTKLTTKIHQHKLCPSSTWHTVTKAPECGAEKEFLVWRLWFSSLK